MDVTREEVLEFWGLLNESDSWDPVDWIRRCVERPELVLLGADDGETYALLNMREGCIVDCDELDVEQVNWRDLAPQK